jgi:Tol biopolymer transport system component
MINSSIEKEWAAMNGKFLVSCAALVAMIAIRGVNCEAASTSLISADASGKSIEVSGDDVGAITFNSITPDGHFFSFVSDASNLIANDANGVADAFVYNRPLNKIELVSISSKGAQGNSGVSQNTSLSDDGRYVAFISSASNMIDGKTIDSSEIYIRDRSTKTTFLGSSDVDGVPSGSGNRPLLSPDGHILYFQTSSTTLVPGQSNVSNQIYKKELTTGKVKVIESTASNRFHISKDGKFLAVESTNDGQMYLKNLETGAKELVSFDYNDTSRTKGANGTSDATTWPEFSADGRFLVYTSDANNLVANDTNNAFDIFLYDIATKKNERVSLGTGGVQLATGVFCPTSEPVGRVSQDGRFVAYTTTAGVYLYDRQTKKAEAISVDAKGGIHPISSIGKGVLMSDDASTIVFTTDDSLVPSGAKKPQVLYLRDRRP